MDSDLRRISAPVTDRMAAMGEIFAALGTAGIAVEDLAVRRPTLDEVFMELTGHPAERESAETTRTEAAA
jgi:ABC-2 type transport system ATP-binding protein